MKMLLKLGEVLTECLAEKLAIRLFHLNQRPWYALTNTHVDCSYFSIHELILCRRTLKPLTRQLHWIPRIVDISQHLHRYHGCQGLYHIVNRGKVLDYVIPGKQLGSGLQYGNRRQLTPEGQLACLRQACRALWLSH